MSGGSAGSSDSEGQRTVREEEQSRGRIREELRSLITARESLLAATESPRDAEPPGQGEKHEEVRMPGIVFASQDDVCEYI